LLILNGQKKEMTRYSLHDASEPRVDVEKINRSVKPRVATV
jgi:hypothetical protein